MSNELDLFLGIKTADWNLAKLQCEALIGRPLRCTNSMFYGGDHCHTLTEDAGYDLRLNHHDDGWGWSWCVNNPQYPLVLSCNFRSPAARERIFMALRRFDLIEIPGNSG